MKNYTALDENFQFHSNIFYIIKLIQLSQLTKAIILNTFGSESFFLVGLVVFYERLLW